MTWEMCLEGRAPAKGGEGGGEVGGHESKYRCCGRVDFN